LFAIRLCGFSSDSSFLGSPPTLELQLGDFGLLVLAFLLLNLEQALGRHLELVTLSLSIAFMLLYVEQGHGGRRAR
jgi:hypothetical protein